MIDRPGFAEFLRHRRESIQPEDVQLPRAGRRKTNGLRREEVAELCHISVDYYGRMEQGRGPRPSSHMISSIARGLRLSPSEREHLFHLAGHNPPTGDGASERIGPGMLNVFNQITDVPAEIITELGVTLRQNRLSRAVTGDRTGFTGSARSIAYRWFTDPATRERYHPADHERVSEVFASESRKVATRRGPGSRAARLSEALLKTSPEFSALWNEHRVGVSFDHPKRFLHPELGTIALQLQTLIDPVQPHRLIVYTAANGAGNSSKLDRLASGAVDLERHGFNSPA